LGRRCHPERDGIRRHEPEAREQPGKNWGALKIKGNMKPKTGILSFKTLMLFQTYIVEMFGVSKMFLKHVSCAHQGRINFFLCDQY